MKKQFISIILLILLCFSACSPAEKEDSGSNDSIILSENPFDKDDSEKSVDEDPNLSISTAVLSPETNEMKIDYSGEPIEIEYEYSVLGACSVGLVLWVDGLVQPYTMKGSDTETNMEVFQFNENETRSIKFSFQPITGNQGDKIEIIFSNILDPEVKTFQENEAINFEHSHKISQSLPWIIEMQVDAEAKAELDISDDFSVVEMSSEERESYINIDQNGNRRDSLDFVHIEIVSGNEFLDTILDTNDSDTVEVNVFTNQIGKFRVAFFGDLERIDIGSTQYYEIEVFKDSISQISVPSSTFSSYSNVYAVAVPLHSQEGVIKTSTLVVKD